ncbi:MAG TPA: tripartite tricarboxylate transporter TctB family protein, partial [Desulfobacterales bacterium]|nr:tripartite tricarboxylate transporter TctB family protein [Desulfobacterales bacterium]
LNVALIAEAGFILATTVLFAATSRGFGSRRPWRDAAIGFALATLVWLAFDRGLGYRIGTGLVENLL